MNKHYKLIVGHDFSLSNETDCDVQTDYFPGIWGMGSQKKALQYSREILEKGGTITVTDYDNANYHSLANYFIKELGLSQSLFPEPKALEQGLVTNGKPSNLSQLKKYLAVGKVIGTRNFYREAMIEKDTSVLATQTNQVVFEKTLGDGVKSWFDFGKASEWVFTNSCASKYSITNEGENKLGYQIIYKD